MRLTQSMEVRLWWDICSVCVQGHGDSVAISSHLPCDLSARGLILSLRPCYSV